MDKKKLNYKGIGLILLMLMTVVLSGCNRAEDVRASVVKPRSAGISIEGRYTYKEVINLEEGRFVDETNFRNFTAEFDLNGAQIGLEKVEEPRYIAKLVNTFDYFLEKYRVNPSRLRITNESMEVISVSTSGRSFYEVFKLDDENIAVVKGSNLIKLERTDSKAEKAGDMEESGGFGTMEFEEGEPAADAFFEPNAGVLIGLRDDRDEETGKADYRTLWITNDGEVQEVYEIDDILFPRKEFWKLQVLSEEVDGEEKERLNIYAITGTPSNVKENIEYRYPSRILDVSFVGNNYVSFLATDDEEEDRDLMPKAMTIPVDSYNNYRPVNINEVDPRDGATSFLNSLTQALQRNEELKDAVIPRDEILSNFILKRHHGYWMMESRFTIDEEDSDEIYKVPIALKPSQNLVTYDDLTVPWAKIKERVPKALDAFNAPGNSFILVRTPKYLMMYQIEGVDNISREPLQIIEIREQEQIIMAEWARGEFVKRWTDVAAKEGRKIIFVQNRK